MFKQSGSLSQFICHAKKFVLTSLAACSLAASVHAAPVLTVETISWGIIGLDSNNVTVGPNQFPVNVRVTNTGDATATNIVGTFVWDTANPYINLAPGSTATTTWSSLAPGESIILNYVVEVTRNAAAYETARRFHVNVTADGLGTSTDPVTRELYVEKMLSQQRNDVISLTGPDYIQAGEVYTFTLTGETINNGAEQLELALNLPNTIFQILSISTTYSAPPGATSDSDYADACGWQPNPTLPNYRSCVGPENFTGGKAGGDVVVVYTVLALANNTSDILISPIILDKSGNSYHYNSDFGIVKTIPASTDLAVIKTSDTNPVEAGDTFTYLLTVQNLTSTTAVNVKLIDTLPSGVTFVSASPAQTLGPNPLLWSLGSIASNQSKTVQVTVRAECSGLGTVVNKAKVCTSTDDLNPSNNETSESVQITETKPPVINCPSNIVKSNDPGLCSAVVTYSVTASDTGCCNNGHEDCHDYSYDYSSDSIVSTTSGDCEQSVSPTTGGGGGGDPTPCTNPVTVTCTPPPGSVFPVGTTTVTCTATDSNGNTSTCTFTVTVNDTENPTIDCPPDVNGHTTEGFCSATLVSLGDPTVNDNCGIDSVTNDAPEIFLLGTTIVTWTVEDIHGNTATCSQRVTITDNEAPRITCPDDIILSNTADQCNAVNVEIKYPAVSDNCHPETLEGVRSDGLELSDPYPVGTTIITWTVEDTSGNTAQCDQLVIIVDAQPPTLTCPGPLTFPASPGVCSGFAAYQVQATDNCLTGGVTLESFPPSGSNLPVGVTDVITTATDAAGNVTTCTFPIIIEDKEAPLLNCPPSIAQVTSPGECSAVVNYSVRATDNCGGQVTVVCTPASGTVFPIGVTMVTCTATDAAGNTSQCTFSVTIRDLQPPTISCPENIVVNTQPGMCSAVVTYDVPATDNCGGQIITTCFPPSGSVFPKGVTPVTCTATDQYGNTSTCTFNVTVLDNEAPTLTCPANITVGNDQGLCGAIVNYTVGATDACPGTVTTVCTPPSGSIFPVGTTTVTCTAIDDSGNQASCSFTVTVNDTQNPTITCPPPVSVAADDGTCTATNVQLGQPITNDNCGVDTVTNNAPTEFPLGTTIVTWTVTDIHGNTATCTQTVTVTDNEPPLITCAADVNLQTAPGECQSSANVVLTPPATSDNCLTETLTAVRSDFLPLNAPYPIGTTIVTWTITDDSGNTAVCSQQVIVADKQPPLLECPTDISVSAQQGACSAVVTFEIRANDNCDQLALPDASPRGARAVSVVAVPPSGSVFPVGTTTVNVTATDDAGNVATCSFTVTVNDLTPPTIQCPANITVATTPGQCGAIAQFTVGATDNCAGPVIVTCTPGPGSLLPLGTTTVNCVATDASGNTATCSFNITVVDNNVPVIQGPNEITVNTDPGQCSAVVNYNVTATDGCGTISSLTCTPPPGFTFPKGTTQVTCIATDGSGNSITHVFNVNVVDSEQPVITCPADVTVESATFPAIVDIGTATAVDNCGVVSITNNAPGQFPQGTTVVTWTVTDVSGNTATCTQNVTVIGPLQALPLTNCPDLTGDPGPVKLTCKQKKGKLQCKWSVCVYVRNIGDVTAGATTVRFYASNDTQFDSSDTPLQQKNLKSLKPGKRVLVTSKGCVNADLRNQYVIAVIDPDGIVNECLETNNNVIVGPLGSR